jgi:hypothetical protein
MTLRAGLVRRLRILGGVLVAPRATLRALLFREQAPLGPLLALMILVAAASAPTETGRALLLARGDLLDGASLLGSVLAGRLLAPLAGAFAAAVPVWALGRRGSGPAVGFDRALDATLYVLVPWILLAAVGVLGEPFGVDFWAFPHRPMRGPPDLVAWRAVAGFGWPLLCWGVLLREAARGPEGGEGSPVAAGETVTR